MKVFLSVILSLFATATVFAKDHAASKVKDQGMIIHRINCEVKGVQIMTFTKDDCEKIEGKWIEDKDKK